MPYPGWCYFLTDGTAQLKNYPVSSKSRLCISSSVLYVLSLGHGMVVQYSEYLSRRCSFWVRSTKNVRLKWEASEKWSATTLSRNIKNVRISYQCTKLLTFRAQVVPGTRYQVCTMRLRRLLSGAIYAQTVDYVVYMWVLPSVVRAYPSFDIIDDVRCGRDEEVQS